MSAHVCSGGCEHAPLGAHGVRADVGRALLCECGLRVPNHREHVKVQATLGMVESMDAYRKSKRTKRGRDLIDDAVHFARVLLSATT